ncbi:class I fructose-bisphosphate aldolase [Candidatus Margulisiibacteriota bacterium]
MILNNVKVNDVYSMKKVYSNPSINVVNNSKANVIHPRDIKAGQLTAIMDWIIHGGNADNGVGIIAADESLGTIGKRLKSIGLPNIEANRRLLRSCFIEAAGIHKAGGSGMILFTESFDHATKDGVKFGEALRKAGVIPIVKPDLGAKKTIGAAGEMVTTGLQHPYITAEGKPALMSLKAKLDEMVKKGALAAKWRAAIKVDPKKGLPTDACIDANATNLALYAIACHQAGIVPMVEPEVLFSGTQTMKQYEVILTKVLNAVFNKLKLYKVDLSKIILKTNMVCPGKDTPEFNTVTPEEVAKATIRCFKNSVPAEVRTQNFLSGGLSDQQAYKFLSAINKLAVKSNAPWNLSFSYGRAIVRDALKEFGIQMKKPAWERDYKKVQDAFLKSVNRCRLAGIGEYETA